MRIINYFRLVMALAGIGLLLLHSQQPARAGQPPAETSLPEIDAYIEARMRALGIPGLAVAIVQGDKIVYARGYGAADDHGRPVTPQTPFYVASFSKSFTALGIMQLVEEGRLRLDDPVQAHLPWFQLADPDSAAQITIQHLLHHSSGLSALEGYVKNLDRDASSQALEAGVRRLARSRLNAPPGEQFEYSNTNYDILGLIIQTVSGKSYEDFIAERIYAPLNMRNSHTSLDAARLGGLSSGYVSFFGGTVNFDRLMPYSRSVTPSAGLFSSAEDMAQYLFAHLRQGRGPNGAVILSPSGTAALHTPGIQINEHVGYALGWVVFPFPEAEAPGEPEEDIPTGISHAGDWANYKSLMLLVPERELGLVMLMNKNLPSQAAAYENIFWNTALLALGLEPTLVPLEAGFFARYGRLLGVGAVLLLAANAVLSARILLRSSSSSDMALRRRRSAVFFSVLLLLDLALAGFLWFVLLPEFVTTLPLSLRFEPDIGLIYLLILVLTLGWGSIRTFLAVRR